VTEGTEQFSELLKISLIGWSSIEPAGPRLVLRHYRPIVLGLAMRHRAEQSIAPDISRRQRHANSTAGLKREIGILQAQDGALAGRLKRSSAMILP